jgi:hypothetical protein
MSPNRLRKARGIQRFEGECCIQEIVARDGKPPVRGKLANLKIKLGTISAESLQDSRSVHPYTMLNHASLRAIVRGGFNATGGVCVPGSRGARLAFYQFVVRAAQDGRLRLQRILRQCES